jgi:hypothetical protein
VNTKPTLTVINAALKSGNEAIAMLWQSVKEMKTISICLLITGYYAGLVSAAREIPTFYLPLPVSFLYLMAFRLEHTTGFWPAFCFVFMIVLLGESVVIWGVSSNFGSFSRGVSSNLVKGLGEMISEGGHQGAACPGGRRTGGLVMVMVMKAGGL